MGEVAEEEETVSFLPLTYEELGEATVSRHQDKTLTFEYKKRDDEFCERVRLVIESMLGMELKWYCYSPVFSAVLNEDKSTLKKWKH